MTDALKEMFNSKKHLSAFLILIIIISNKKFALGLNQEDIRWMVGTVIALILGQGASDAFGKGKLMIQAKLNSNIHSPPTPPKS